MILLIQGNTGGSLMVRRALDAAGCRTAVDVAEMDNYPYSCWRLSPIRIRPIVKKRWLQIASLPGKRIQQVFPRLQPLFPHAVVAPDIIHTGFTNANAILHVANCVANAGRIDGGESYKFYAEGVTPAVARLVEAIDAERVCVAAALGASVPKLEDWFERVYGVRGATLVETCRLLTTNSDGPYQATGTPDLTNMCRAKDRTQVRPIRHRDGTAAEGRAAAVGLGAGPARLGSRMPLKSRPYSADRRTAK